MNIYRPIGFICLLAALLQCSVSSAQSSCDTLRIFNLDEVYSQYLSGKFATIFFNDTRCQYFSDTTNKNHWSEDCHKCHIRTYLIPGEKRDSLIFGLTGIDHVSLTFNSDIVQPTAIGEQRVAYALRLPPGDTSLIDIELTIQGNELLTFHLFSWVDESIQQFVDYGEIKRHTYFYNFAFTGGLLFMALIYLSSFFFSRRKDMLFYGIYAMVVCVYYGAKFLSVEAMINYELGRFVELTIQPLMYVAYLYFMKYFIDTKRDHPQLNRLYDVSNVFLITICLLIGLTVNTNVDHIAIILYNSYRIIAVLVALYIIYYLIRHDTPLIRFLIFGHIALTVGSVIAMVFSYYVIRLGPIRPIHWMMAGVGIEMIVFAAGIGYRTYLSNQEKLSIQNTLIDRMKENETSLQARQRELSGEVDKARVKFEKEVKEKVSAEYSLQQKEIELGLLRHQMNPHFIFNSLNSIKSFIVKNKPRVASDFLTKFAALMRLILSNSKEREIIIDKELKAISLYMELEQIRLIDKFSYEIKIADDIDVEQIKIQPLILQPFIENAIWHGIRHKEEKGNIVLSIDSQEDHLVIKIIDDGIGIKAASLSAQNSLTKTKSYGIEITKERLRKHYKGDFEVTVGDLDSSKIETGTVVSIRVPIRKTS